jgi:hypothetical protein
MRAFTADRGAVLLVAIGFVIGVTGCGQVGAKQVRIESSSVASTATEGATIASELGRGRLPSTFARVQFKKLAASASGPADALGKSAPSNASRAMAADTQALALESQGRLNDLAEHASDAARREANYKRLTEIADRASNISERAEAIE